MPEIIRRRSKGHLAGHALDPLLFLDPDLVLDRGDDRVGFALRLEFLDNFSSKALGNVMVVRASSSLHEYEAYYHTYLYHSDIP